MKYNNRDDEGDNEGNKYRNDSSNVASGSGSNVPIFDLITTHWYCGGGYRDKIYSTVFMAHYIYTCCIIYLSYKYHIKYVP